MRKHMMCIKLTQYLALAARYTHTHLHFPPGSDRISRASPCAHPRKQTQRSLLCGGSGDGKVWVRWRGQSMTYGAIEIRATHPCTPYRPFPLELHDRSPSYKPHHRAHTHIHTPTRPHTQTHKYMYKYTNTHIQPYIPV